jgi:hypothetical protein
MRLFPLFYAAILASGATLSVTVPPYLSDCPNGYATASLSWSGATGQVQIRVGSATGPAMTAFTNPTGTAQAGPWVTDGMQFFLVDQSGAVQASAAATFSCGGTPRTLDLGVTGGSYFPLAVGNTWVYRSDSRFTTADYTVWSITGTQVIGGQTYYVLAETIPVPTPAYSGVIALLRAGANGVIYQNTSAGDQIYLDPNASGIPRPVYSGPLGTFTDAVETTVNSGGFELTRSIYVRGLGLANMQTQILTGSDGGFSDGYELVDVRVDGIHLSLPAPKIALAIENTDLDLNDQLVPNCAVPCYFAACRFVPGADPPGTYRPCAQVRIDTSAAVSGYSVLLQLLNANGTAVFQKTTPVAGSSGLAYVQLPLYTAPLVLFPAGDYKLAASIVGQNATLAESSIAVHIR